MFKNLSNRLSNALHNLSSNGQLTEKNIKDTLRAVRIALLEADVALPVINDFINSVYTNALGQAINKSLTPGQTFISIVKKEMTHAMGTVNIGLNLATQPPAVILIAGLQGAGKTTSIAKLGKFLKEKHQKKVLAVSTDVYRPAAIKQLAILAQEIEIDFFPSDIQEQPTTIARSALQYAKKKFYDVLLVDTAGRLHINEIMMKEMQQIYDIIHPIETLFVVDAMTGQDAANIAKTFNAALPFTGIILTKVDGDTRGGAALSIRHITGKPIKFLGVGEKAQALEPFYPDRIASRILGMGDILSLIDDIENTVNRTQTEKLAQKLKKSNDFDLTDFMEQLKQMRQMGGVNHILTKIPGIGQLSKNITNQIDDKLLFHMEAIIMSMTLKERSHPTIIKGSRKKRIAQGSGMQVQDVNNLLKQFDQMQRIMKQIKKGGFTKTMMRNIEGMIPPGLFGK
ncbi:Signal recognition particle protein [Candidatus Profftia lariciata]|uniref:signal recognition particle protein n=1 Tax=Candidatus Profftia lariciata TaxID=1987921 RepID=UPI001D01173A|nr:signal recognition particle protein [Candidatus Profftia lariciata]UDG81288.1 Signal recognition particle protein [Candidatus Profftia lariciata]